MFWVSNQYFLSCDTFYTARNSNTMNLWFRKYILLSPSGLAAICYWAIQLQNMNGTVKIHVAWNITVLVPQAVRVTSVCPLLSPWQSGCHRFVQRYHEDSRTCRSDGWEAYPAKAHWCLAGEGTFQTTCLPGPFPTAPTCWIGEDHRPPPAAAIYTVRKRKLI